MQKTIIIADIGINANGSVDIAKELILASKNAGIDLVKFQKRNVDLVYTKAELDKPRESPWGKTNREQKLGLEFDENKAWDEKKEIYRVSGKIIRTANITQSAIVKDGYTTVVSAAVFLF